MDTYIFHFRFDLGQILQTIESDSLKSFDRLAKNYHPQVYEQKRSELHKNVLNIVMTISKKYLE
jgi:hypothetical protein